MEKNKMWIYGGLSLIALFAILMVTGVVNFQAVGLASTFTPVYCNDPTSLCCVKTETTASATVDKTISWQCPANKISCEFTYSPTQTYIYTSASKPTIVSKLANLYVPILESTSQSVKLSPSSPVTILGGSYVWSDRATQLSIKEYGQKLVTNLGANVLSDSCAFSVSSGQKITDNSENDLGVSYTVPVGSGVGTKDSCILSWTAGNRHICGNLEEQCDADSDCIGHTFGNKECSNRVLQTYGCKSYPIPSNLNIGFLGQQTGDIYADLGTDTSSTTKYGTLSRCEIKSSINVQCCGDTDCGSNAVCDTTSFTCKTPTQVGCTEDSQCGVSQICDYGSSQLKTPDCKSDGKCGYTTKSIECCSDVNCPDNSFCNTEYKCEVSNPDIKVACPLQCCVGVAGYFDKKCASGSYCNGEGACISSPVCSSDSDCDITKKCVNGECIQKETICEAKLGGLVPSKLVTKSTSGLFSSSTFYECQDDYTIIVVIGAVIVLLGVGYMYFIKGRR